MIQQWEDNRPHLTNMDLAILQTLPDNLPGAVSLLVGGEVSGDELGDIVYAKVMALNDYPQLNNNVLVTPTEYGTLRLLRWQFKKDLWMQFPRNIRNMMFARETKRLGLEKWTEEFNNFYQGVIYANNLYNCYIKDECPITQTYLNGVMVFNKPTALDIQPHTFFCQTVFQDIKIIPMTDAQKELRDIALCNETQRLTNKELDFLFEIVKNQPFST